MKAALQVEPQRPGPALQDSIQRIADRIVFYGVFGLLAFAPLAFGAVQAWAIFVLESGVAMLFLVWLFSQAKSGELKIWGNPLFAPMAVFAALIALQVLLGRTSYRYQTIHYGMLYGAYGFLCFLAVQCLRKTSQVYFLTAAVSAYGLGISVFAIFQSITSPGKLYWLVTPHSGAWIFGPYVNHNHYAGLMEMLIPIPLVASLSRLPQVRQRWLALLAATIMASTVFVCGSRGGMLAFCVQIAMVGLLLLRHGESRNISLALVTFLVALAVVALWLGGDKMLDRMVSIRSETSTEISGGTRLEILRDGIKMWRTRPIFGYGLGNFPEVYPQYRSFYTNLFVNEAHNDYVQLLVEMGALGFLTMLWFVTRMCHGAAKKLTNWTSDVDGALTLTALLGCTGILVHSLVDFNLQVPANAALFYVLCTLAAMEPRFPLLYGRGNHRFPRENAKMSA